MNAAIPSAASALRNSSSLRARISAKAVLRSRVGTTRRRRLVAATASYKVTDGVEVYGRVENLFDVRYEDPLGFAHPGLAGYAGLRVRY